MGAEMMGRRDQGQGQLFYEFRLDEAVPDDHLVRKIRALLDLSWVYAELAPYYSEIGRPSIDPVLMIRMLIIGYVFAIRAERQICREVLRLCRQLPDRRAVYRSRHQRRLLQRYLPQADVGRGDRNRRRKIALSGS